MSSKERRLREEVNHLRQRLSTLESALEVLDEFEDTPPGEEKAENPPAATPVPESEATVDTRPYPTAAIRGLFEAEPTRKWRPMELAARLEQMQLDNLLRGKKERDVMDVTHTALRDLTQQGFISKHQPQPGSRQSYYVKAAQEP